MWCARLLQRVEDAPVDLLRVLLFQLVLDPERVQQVVRGHLSGAMEAGTSTQFKGRTMLEPRETLAGSTGPLACKYEKLLCCAECFARSRVPTVGASLKAPLIYMHTIKNDPALSAHL